MSTDTTIAADWPVRALSRMEGLMLTVTDLATAAGYRQYAMAKRHLDGTSTPTWKTIEAYAAALRCTPEWLARGEGEYPDDARHQRLSIAEMRGIIDTAATPDIGQRFKKARLHAGLTGTQLGERVKVVKQQISKLENGEIEDPGGRMLFRYEDVTGYSARWLATGAGPELRGAPPTGQINAELHSHALQLMEDAFSRLGRTSVPRRARSRIHIAIYSLLATGKSLDEAIVDSVVTALG